MSDFNTSKVDGNTVAAVEWNQLADIDNLVINSGQTPSSSNLDQLAIASARYSSGGQFFTDSGIANAYVLTPVSPFMSPVSSGGGEGYFTGMIIHFRAGNANSGASTVNVNGAGVKNLKKADGTDVATGDILATRDVIFRYNGTNFIKVDNINPATTTAQGIVYLNNPVSFTFNGSTALDFTAGNVNYDNGNAQLLCSAITSKTLQSSGSWGSGSSANGLDTGARANSTWYNIFDIVNNSTGANDILYSLSRTAPTIPSGYTLVAWKGRIRTDASGNIDQNYLAKRTNFGQEIFVKNSSYLTGTTTIPLDNTIPQNTEGDEYMSLEIIPLSDKSRLTIEVNSTLAHSATGTMQGAIFRDSTASAIRAMPIGYIASVPATILANIKHEMQSPTNSATTFKFRAGSNSAGTTYFNGNGAGLYNGTCISIMTIREVL